MGLMAWTGKSIDVMVVMIPAILLIVSLSDVIHFIHKYDELVGSGYNKTEAIQKTILSIGKATFLTSITTAIGFLGLIFIPIQPIQEFGLFTSAGVILAFIITFLTLPSLLFLFPSTIEKRNSFGFSWQGFLERTYELIISQRRIVLIFLAVLSLLSIAGISQLRLSTSLIVGLQKNEPELKTVAYFDQNYDGYKPFELGIELGENKSLFDPDVIKRIEKIELYLKSKYGVNHIQSPLNLLREINAGIHGGARKYVTIPEVEDLAQIERYYNSLRLIESRSQVQNKTGDLIRIIGQVPDLGSGHYHDLNYSLIQFLNSEINGNGFEARLTGASYLIDKTDQYVVNSLVKGIGFALISVSVFVLFFFRNWRISLITLIPNLIPIAILFGLMGWFQVDLNISTAIIFTVALGIALDDSIHFIARYQQELKVNNNSIAIKNAFTGTGKSILVTSLIIILGFSVFLSSGFSASYFLGFFIVLAAAIAVIFDLLLLPILLKKKP